MKKRSPGCQCCKVEHCSSDGKICVSVTDNCAIPTGVPGASVTVTQTFSGASFTCIADGDGACCVTVTEGAPYTVTVGMSGFSDQSQTIYVGCGATVNLAFKLGGQTCEGGRFCVTVADACSPSHVIGGATVTATDASGNVYSCSTDGVGQCCIDVPRSCVYSIQASVPNASSVAQKVMAPCSVDTDVNVTIEGVGTIEIGICVCDETNTDDLLTGNPSAGSGGSVMVSGGGTTTTTSPTTTVGGCATAVIVAGEGSVSVTINFPDGESCSFDFGVEACSTTGISGTEITTQYFGVGGDGSYPLGCTVTFTLTGGTTGTCTLTTSTAGPYADACLINLSPPLIFCGGDSVTYFLKVVTSGGNNSFGPFNFTTGIDCTHSASNNPNFYVFDRPGC